MRVFAFSAAAVACAIGAAAQGSITGISGGGIIHEPPPANIGLPNNQQALVVQGFNEVQGLTLAAPLGVFSISANANIVIPAGTAINSHMVLFDPVGTASVQALVGFDATIIGVIFEDAPLFNTHTLLGRAGVNYPGAVVTAYGFESTESVTLINPQTIRFASTASNPGDRFRVITVVPTPGAAAMLGLVGIVAGRRRR